MLVPILLLELVVFPLFVLTLLFEFVVFPPFDELLLFEFVFCCGLVTVTLHLADTPLPSEAEQVIVAAPVDFAVTFPYESTVATFVLLLDHFTDLFVASSGITVAFNVTILPVSIFALV